MTPAELELLILIAETLKLFISRNDTRNGRQLYLALEKLRQEQPINNQPTIKALIEMFYDKIYNEAIEKVAEMAQYNSVNAQEIRKLKK